MLITTALKFSPIPRRSAALAVEAAVPELDPDRDTRESSPPSGPAASGAARACSRRGRPDTSDPNRAQAGQSRRWARTRRLRSTRRSPSEIASRTSWQGIARPSASSTNAVRAWKMACLAPPADVPITIAISSCDRPPSSRMRSARRARSGRSSRSSSREWSCSRRSARSSAPENWFPRAAESSSTVLRRRIRDMASLCAIR